MFPGRLQLRPRLMPDPNLSVRYSTGHYLKQDRCKATSQRKVPHHTHCRILMQIYLPILSRRPSLSARSTGRTDTRLKGFQLTMGIYMSCSTNRWMLLCQTSSRRWSRKSDVAACQVGSNYIGLRYGTPTITIESQKSYLELAVQVLWLVYDYIADSPKIWRLGLAPSPGLIDEAHMLCFHLH
jgi:hypothetical protein